MAVQIAVEAKITEDVEGVIDVLERPAELVAAVAAFAEDVASRILPRSPTLILAAISRSCISE